MQWQAAFQKGLCDLMECGLPKSGRESFLDYIAKCGKELGMKIVSDVQPRPDRSKDDGTNISREPETWDECHAFVRKKGVDRI